MHACMHNTTRMHARVRARKLTFCTKPNLHTQLKMGSKQRLEMEQKMRQVYGFGKRSMCFKCRPCLWCQYHRLLGTKWQYLESCFCNFQTLILTSRMRNQAKKCCVYIHNYCNVSLVWVLFYLVLSDWASLAFSSFCFTLICVRCVSEVWCSCPVLSFLQNMEWKNKNSWVPTA